MNAYQQYYKIGQLVECADGNSGKIESFRYLDEGQIVYKVNNGEYHNFNILTLRTTDWEANKVK